MKRALSHLLVVVAVLSVVLLTGCPGPSFGTVSGEVTLDGNPIKQGMIRFVPTDGQSQPADGPITDGKYTVAKVPTGEKTVQITASRAKKSRKMYDTPDSPAVEEFEEIPLPARYNTRSELRLSVKAGEQQQKFEVKSK